MASKFQELEMQCLVLLQCGCFPLWVNGNILPRKALTPLQVSGHELALCIHSWPNLKTCQGSENLLFFQFRKKIKLAAEYENVRFFSTSLPHLNFQLQLRPQAQWFFQASSKINYSSTYSHYCNWLCFFKKKKFVFWFHLKEKEKEEGRKGESEKERESPICCHFALVIHSSWGWFRLKPAILSPIQVFQVNTEDLRITCCLSEFRGGGGVRSRTKTPEWCLSG